MSESRKPLPVVTGTHEIVTEGARALGSLPDLLHSLKGEDDYDEAAVSEIAIWENMPITASVFHNLQHVQYGWNGKRWVETIT